MIDINTVLTSACLALLCWTLKTVYNVSTAQAASKEKDAAQDAQLTENRARIIDVERNVGQLQVSVGKLQENAEHS